MRVVVRPIMDPRQEIDLTHRLVETIAEELWKRFGGNDKVNWLEAELHLNRILGGQARSQASPTIGPLPAPDRPRSNRPLRRRRSRSPGAVKT